MALRKRQCGECHDFQDAIGRTDCVHTPDVGTCRTSCMHTATYTVTLPVLSSFLLLCSCLFLFSVSSSAVVFLFSIEFAVISPETINVLFHNTSPRVMFTEVMRCPDKREPAENKDQPQLAYGARVDAWACGVLAYELLVGCPPFGMSTREGSIKAILSSAPKIPAWLPAGGASFIQAALTKKPSNRPTVRKLLQHPWIQAHMYDA